MDTAASSWWTWLEHQLRLRDWSPAILAHHAGISHTRVTAWKKGGTVTIETARAIAHALDVPLLTVLVEAKILTPEEARLNTTAPDLDPASLSNDILFAEVNRRMTQVKITQEMIDNDPEGWVTSADQDRKRRPMTR